MSITLYSELKKWITIILIILPIPLITIISPTIDIMVITLFAYLIGFAGGSFAFYLEFTQKQKQIPKPNNYGKITFAGFPFDVIIEVSFWGATKRPEISYENLVAIIDFGNGMLQISAATPAQPIASDFSDKLTVTFNLPFEVREGEHNPFPLVFSANPTTK